VKVAEEEGLIIRLWECAGHDVDVRIAVDGLGALARTLETDLLERDRGVLATSGQEARTRLSARGLITARLLLT
jgi:hypothetical protein